MSTKPWVRMLHHIDTLNVKGVADQLEDDIATGREEETEEHISWFPISPFQGEEVFIFFFHQPCNWGEVLRPETKVVLHKPIKAGPVSKLLLALELFWDVMLDLSWSSKWSFPWPEVFPPERLPPHQQDSAPHEGETSSWQCADQSPKDPPCGCLWKITLNLWVTVSHETHHVDGTMWNDKLWVCSSNSGLNAFWLRIDRNDNI